MKLATWLCSYMSVNKEMFSNLPGSSACCEKGSMEATVSAADCGPYLTPTSLHSSSTLSCG